MLISVKPDFSNWEWIEHNYYHTNSYKWELINYIPTEEEYDKIVLMFKKSNEKQKKKTLSSYTSGYYINKILFISVDIANIRTNFRNNKINMLDV